MSNSRNFTLKSYGTSSVDLYQLIEDFQEIVSKYPNAYLTHYSDYADGFGIIVEVAIQDTELDKQLAEARNCWQDLKRVGIPTYEVVIQQDAPIEEATLEAIKNDGKNDVYEISRNRCQLLKKYPKELVAQRRANLQEEIVKAGEKVKELYKLQEDQDKKYLM